MENGSLFSSQKKKKGHNSQCDKVPEKTSVERKEDLLIGQLPTLNKTCSTSFDFETGCRFYHYLLQYLHLNSQMCAL